MRRIGVVLIAVLFACLSLLDVADAAKQKKPKLAAPPRPIYDAPMRVVIVRNSQPECEPRCPQWIAAEGEITSATPALFRKVLKQMGKEKLPVIIRSPGGSINAALEIGKMLRQRQMTAAVGATIFRGCSPADSKCKLPKESKGIYDGLITESYAFCNSACPMVLAGATTRYASYRTSVGLHEPKTTWLSTRTNYREYYRIVNGKKKVTSRKILSKKTFVSKTTYGLDKRLGKRLGDYYKTMGVDVAMLEEMVKAKYKDIYVLPDDKRASLKLRTTMEQAVFLGNPNHCGSGATSAVCVMDKNRDPKVLTMAREKSMGLEPGAKPMTFRLVELETANCTDSCAKMIVAEGRITDRTQDNFATFLGSVKPGKIAVVLHSDGGDLSAALHMAQRIRMEGITTSVGEAVRKLQRVSPEDIVVGLCKGACAIVFAGGVSRILPEGQELSLFNPDVLSVGSQQKTILLNVTLASLDVKRELMSDLHKLAMTKVQVIKAKDAVRYALATDVRPVVFAVERGDCSFSNLLPHCRSVDVTKQISKPKTFNRIASEFWFAISPKVVVSDISGCSTKCPVWIVLDGRIMPKTDEQVEALYSQLAPLKPTAVINSPGGDLGAAFRIAKFFKRQGINTALGVTKWHTCTNFKDCQFKNLKVDFQRGKIFQNAICEGACVLAFAGGQTRITSGTDRVKMYDLATLNKYSTVKVNKDDLALMLDNLGIHSSLAEKIGDISAGEELFLNEAQLYDYRLVNTSERIRILDDPKRCQPGKNLVICLPLK